MMIDDYLAYNSTQLKQHRCKNESLTISCSVDRMLNVMDNFKHKLDARKEEDRVRQ